jgi:hypothetical protein
MKLTKSELLAARWQKFLMFKTKSSQSFPVQIAAIANFINVQPALLEILLTFLQTNVSFTVYPVE